MGILKDGRFWIGAVVGYLFLVCFPQFNIRTRGAR
jgi:hypothetical protein